MSVIGFTPPRHSYLFIKINLGKDKFFLYNMPWKFKGLGIIRTISEWKSADVAMLTNSSATEAL